ncbi:hypothetical protein BDDG_12218 [Blastomyces dermatitidis ATCC 18188]|uniref:Uncharacterized protein n=1 Tax=Ajellomyces dermatitidis (strain ATCC 18188 / CBS 674.68) TaxID=653446 RepID=A0A0J9ENJ8_AJEDA|nr:hypothetical protein BDDG_12218 [Blastomyces dermatitidis ATCC 18188]
MELNLQFSSTGWDDGQENTTVGGKLKIFREEFGHHLPNHLSKAKMVVAGWGQLIDEDGSQY